MLMFVCIFAGYALAALLLFWCFLPYRRRIAARRLHQHIAGLRHFRYRVISGKISVTVASVTRNEVIYAARRDKRLIGQIMTTGSYPMVRVYVRHRHDQEWSFVRSGYEAGCSLPEIAARYLV